MPRRTIVDPRFPERLRDLLQRRGMSFRALAAHTHYGKSYLNELATGRKAPTVDMARRLDEALDASGELAAMVTDGCGPLAYALEHPRRIDTAAVDQLAADLNAARRLEDTVGPVPLLPTAAARLATVTELAQEARGPVRPRLVMVAAQWAQWGGWLYTATGRYRRAMELFNDGSDWAAEVGNSSLTSSILAFKAYAVGKRGRVTAKEGLLVAARRLPGVHPTQQTYNAFSHARACVQHGERDRGVRLLNVAVGLVDAAVAAGEPPPWGYWYTPAFFKLNLGLTFATLGRHGDAQDLIIAGLAGLPPDQRDAEWTADFRMVLSAPS